MSFHGEKHRPSTCTATRGYFKCFGCGVGGDVIKFVELYDKVAFPEAVRSLAGRFGLTVPEAEDSKEDAEANRDRESLLKAHEVAATWFREQLATPAGAAARRLLNEADTGERSSGRGSDTHRAREAGKPGSEEGSPRPSGRSGMVTSATKARCRRFRTRVMIRFIATRGDIGLAAGDGRRDSSPNT